MTHYVCVGNKSPQRARLQISEYVTEINNQTKSDPQYRFKHFVLPVKESGEQRVECIFQGVNN